MLASIVRDLGPGRGVKPPVNAVESSALAEVKKQAEIRARADELSAAIAGFETRAGHPRG
jgi:hypothetical protein